MNSEYSQEQSKNNQLNSPRSRLLEATRRHEELERSSNKLNEIQSPEQTIAYEFETMSEEEKRLYVNELISKLEESKSKVEEALNIGEKYASDLVKTHEYEISFRDKKIKELEEQIQNLTINNPEMRYLETELINLRVQLKVQQKDLLFAVNKLARRCHK